jgi:hypothetical protein
VYAGLNENLTIVALDSETGHMLGACINVIAVKSDKEETLEDYVEKYKVRACVVLKIYFLVWGAALAQR